MFWISDKETFVAAEEFGHDLEHVEVRKITDRQADQVIVEQIITDKWSCKLNCKMIPNRS